MNYGPPLSTWPCKRCSFPLGDIHSGPVLLVGGRAVSGAVCCPKCGVWRRWHATNDTRSQSDQLIDKSSTNKVQCDIT